jgi:cytoskeletal protein RodZ
VGAFGEKLRRQREHRGLTLDAISTTTKISTRMLSAIEDERFDQLPGGVFNKGFVRAYARQVGLNEEETINGYLTALAESQAHSQAILPNFRNAPASPSPVRENAAPNTPPRPLDKSAPSERRTHADRRNEVRRVDDRPANRPVEPRQHQNGHESERHDDRFVHAEPAVIQGAREDRSYEDEGPSVQPSFLHLADLPAPVANTETFEPGPAADSPSRPIHWERVAIPLVLLILVLALWAAYRSKHPSRESQAIVVSEPVSPAIPATASPTAPAIPPPVSSASTQAKADPATSIPQPSPAQPASDVTKISSPETQVTKPKPLPTFTLTIRAAETSWVSITADGQPVATETLIAPANTSVRAQHEITVKTGNAAGVSFLLNGKEFPGVGNSGEIKTYTFDASGLRDAPAASNADQTN